MNLWTLQLLTSPLGTRVEVPVAQGKDVDTSVRLAGPADEVERVLRRVRAFLQAGLGMAGGPRMRALLWKVHLHPIPPI